MLSSNASAVRHILQHVEHKSYTCSACTESFTTRARLLRHVDVGHHDFNPRASSVLAQTAGTLESHDVSTRYASIQPTVTPLPTSVAKSRDIEMQDVNEEEVSVRQATTSQLRDCDMCLDHHTITEDNEEVDEDDDDTVTPTTTDDGGKADDDDTITSPLSKQHNPINMLPDIGPDYGHSAISSAKKRLRHYENRVERLLERWTSTTTDNQKLTRALKHRERWRVVVEGIRSGIVAMPMEPRVQLDEAQGPIELESDAPDSDKPEQKTADAFEKEPLETVRKLELQAEKELPKQGIELSKRAKRKRNQANKLRKLQAEKEQENIER